MKKKLTATTHWLRANPMASVSAPVRVDKDKRVIHGMVIAQAGQFKDGRGEFNSEGLGAVLKLMANEPKGLKSRLSHATLSDDGVSRYLGRIRNGRLDSTRVRQDGREVEVEAIRGDLHLSDTAFEKNPNGNLGQWLLDLAAEDPGALSSSLVLKAEQRQKVDDRGRRVLDDKGEPVPPLWMPTALHGADIVTMGAAVDDLLGASVDTFGLPDAIVRQGAELLDQQFAGCDRETVRARCVAWLDRYLSVRFGADEPEPGVDEPVKLDIMLRCAEVLGVN